LAERKNVDLNQYFNFWDYISLLMSALLYFYQSSRIENKRFGNYLKLKNTIKY